MLNSFRFPFLLSSALCFLSVSVSATSYFGEETENVCGEETENVCGEVDRVTALMNNPCFVMLAKEFRDNKEAGKSCGFRAAKVKNLIVIAEDTDAKELSDEGIRLKQSFFGKGNLFHRGMEVLWGYEPCAPIKHHSGNPYFLSYADLYGFYRIKGFLEVGSPLADLWEVLFLIKDIVVFNPCLDGDESGSSAEK